MSTCVHFKIAVFFSDTIEKMQLHWTEVHLVNQHECELCNFTFTDSLTHRVLVNSLDKSNIGLIGDLQKHYFHKHRNEKISLKTSFKCLCKQMTKLDQLQNESKDDNNNKEECLFKEWDNCKKHILQQIFKANNSIECYLCNKLIWNKLYNNHMKQVHANEAFYICPQCGPVKRYHNLTLYSMTGQTNPGL